MKCTGNRHLAAFLSGAFAGAMYGYNYCMTKKKYGGNNIFIEIPREVYNEYGYLINEIRVKEFNERIFFPKNDALTNVEIHTWANVDNPFKDYKIDIEFRRKLMKAYKTDWEHRYGVYLDDGWFYIYRSHCILYRFRLTELSSDEWRISDLQKSNDPHSVIKDIREVMISVLTHA